MRRVRGSPRVRPAELLSVTSMARLAPAGTLADVVPGVGCVRLARRAREPQGSVSSFA